MGPALVTGLFQCVERQIGAEGPWHGGREFLAARALVESQADEKFSWKAKKSGNLKRTPDRIFGRMPYSRADPTPEI
jgi:hypothetical protein